MKALVFDIYKGTTHDGPGVRDTVFFKGCPLKCKWCHNPEGIDFKNGIWYEKRLCIGCGECIKICINDALKIGKNGVYINYSLCEGCMSCAEKCPSKALTRIADEYDVKQLTAEIIKDKEYFDVSNGGVTVSGGEAMVQWRFVKEFFKTMKKYNINTCLDTSGFCRKEELEEVLEYTDILLYDLKVIDSELHKKWIGVDNRNILDNILNIKKSGKTIWIRTPIIPGYTDDKCIISEIAEFIKDNLEGYVKRWELCAFNNSCEKKYEKLHMEWSLKDKALIGEEKIISLLEIAKKSGVAEVITSGITKKYTRR